MRIRADRRRRRRRSTSAAVARLKMRAHKQALRRVDRMLREIGYRVRATKTVWWPFPAVYTMRRFPLRIVALKTR